MSPSLLIVSQQSKLSEVSEVFFFCFFGFFFFCIYVCVIVLYCFVFKYTRNSLSREKG